MLYRTLVYGEYFNQIINTKLKPKKDKTVDKQDTKCKAEMFMVREHCSVQTNQHNTSDCLVNIDCFSN